MKGSGDGLGDRGVGGVGSRGVSSRRRESPNPNPFLKVMYQLCVRVKTGATEVMEVVVPLVIGTVPCEEVCSCSLHGAVLIFPSFRCNGKQWRVRPS